MRARQGRRPSSRCRDGRYSFRGSPMAGPKYRDWLPMTQSEQPVPDASGRVSCVGAGDRPIASLRDQSVSRGRDARPDLPRWCPPVSSGSPVQCRPPRAHARRPPERIYFRRALLRLRSRHPTTPMKALPTEGTETVSFAVMRDGPGLTRHSRVLARVPRSMRTETRPAQDRACAGGSPAR